MAGGLEIEIKLRVGDLAHGQDRIAEIQEHLEKMGATLTHPREFEDNTAFDFPDRTIVGKGSLLRVRTLARGTVLTFKGPIHPLSRMVVGTGVTPPPVKARREYEVTIPFDQTDSLFAIIRGLGMAAVFRYQKFRTTWNWRGLHILIDETPIGLYLELEGDRLLIEEGAKALGYRPEHFITKSYHDLYLEHLDRGGEGLDGSRSPYRMVFS